MRRYLHIVLVCITVLAAFSAWTRADAKTIVAITNVDALYDAVNNPANANAELRIARGSYLLSEQRSLSDGSLVARPNDGRLVLQQGMDLVGENQYLLVTGRPQARDVRGETFADPATETILDGSDLKGGEGSPFGSPAIIVAGVGNTIRGLTVRSNSAAAAAILVDQPEAAGMTLTVTDCILEGGRDGGARGVLIVHDFADGMATTVTLARNVIRHHRKALGFGVQVLRIGTSSDSFLINVDHNLIYDNEAGAFFPNLGDSRDTATVVNSFGNIYRNNRYGFFIIGGRDFPLGAGSMRNQVFVDSSDDAFVSNHDGVGVGSGGGIQAIAALRNKGDSTETSENLVHLNLMGTQFINDGGPQNGVLQTLDQRTLPRNDLEIYGALSFASGQSAGVNNRVEVLMTGLDGDPAGRESVFVYAVGSDVPEATNQIVWVGGLDALPQNNPLVPIVVRP
jgi:hypothetical protein